jgi:hypothetical protein
MYSWDGDYQEIKYIRTKPMIECVEQGKYCMKRFLVTRQGQTDTCLKCMEMLDGEAPPLLEKLTKKTKWNLKD